MKNNKLIFAFFISIALSQITVPMSMLVSREIVLKNGMEFKFKTAPVDPYDAFRGRYVALRIEENKAPGQKGLFLKRGQKVYATIVTDEKGFAKFSGVVLSRPQGVPYIQAKVRYVWGEKEIYLDLPIDRYYMEEKAAPRAEKKYWEYYSGHTNQDTYMVVRVKDGIAVIAGLYVAGEKIEDLLKRPDK